MIRYEIAAPILKQHINLSYCKLLVAVIQAYLFQESEYRVSEVFSEEYPPQRRSLPFHNRVLLPFLPEY